MSRIAAGSPYFMAPEVFDHHVDFKCDVWSLGVVLYAMMTCYLPFDAPTPDELANAIRFQDVVFSDELFGGHVSERGKSFVKWLLEKDPTKRPTAAQGLTHPWFRSQPVRLSSISMETVFWDGDRWVMPKPIESSSDDEKETGVPVGVPEQEELRQVTGPRPTFRSMGLFQASQYFINFTKKTSLQRVLLNAITINMNLAEESHIREVSRIFDLLDTNHDGVLSQKELKRGLQMVGVPEYQVPYVMEALDVDDTGNVTFTEFVTPLILADKKEFQQHAMSVFRQIDSEQDGKLSVEEVCEMVFSSGVADTERRTLDELKDFVREFVIRELDTNLDGFIQCEELCEYVSR